MRPPRGDVGFPRHRGAAAPRRPPTRRRTRSTAIALIAFAVTVLVVAVGIVVGFRLTSHGSPNSASRPVGSSTASTPRAPAVADPPPALPNIASIEADFAQLQNTLSGPAGIAFAPVGTPQPPIVLGDWASGPAWSTMKVPLAIAVLRAEDPPTVTDSMTAAITRSDNAAADALWQSLGGPDTAATKVGDILHATGDPTTVQSQKIRPEFSAFGQTDWSLSDQVHFLAAAACDTNDAPIFVLMGQIAGDQQWGLGNIPNARFKGGWGPSESGAYLVRQIGVITVEAGQVAVAIAVQAASGSFDDGTTDLTRIADWLREHAAVLPTGRCPP
jgi:hypothetical protein